MTTQLQEIKNPDIPRTIGMRMNAVSAQADIPEDHVTKSRPEEVHQESTAGGQLTSRIACSKSKCSKRTVPANECSSRALQADVTKALCNIISLKKEYQMQEIPVIMLGDSLCVACMFSPFITLKNILLRTAAKTRSREILEKLPNAIILFAYLPGTENSSDLVSKLFLNPINAINSTLYREGPAMLKRKSTMTGLVFFKITKNEESFFPLPERYIKRSTQKIEDVDKPEKEFGNTEENEGEKCFTSSVQEDCGLFLTRSQRKVKKDEMITEHPGPDTERWKRKHVSVSCEGPGLACKRKKREEPIEEDLELATNHVIGTKIVTKNARINERQALQERDHLEKNQRKSLLKVDHEYIFPRRIFSENFYRRLLHSKFSIKGTMNLTRHALAFLVKIKRLHQGEQTNKWKKYL